MTTDSPPPQREPLLLACASSLCAIWVATVIGGGLYFLAGFYGPLWLLPSSNIAPIIGIFITGPIGLVVGAVLGLVVAFARLTPRTATWSGAAVGLGLGLALVQIPTSASAWFLCGASVATFSLAGFAASVLRGVRRVGILGWLLAAFGVLTGLVGLVCLLAFHSL